jgi:hypothetical protein
VVRTRRLMLRFSASLNKLFEERIGIGNHQMDFQWQAVTGRID